MDNKIVKNIIDTSKGGSRDAPLGPFTFIFMTFAAKILQNILPQIQGWPTVVLEILYPPLNMSLKL